MASSNLRSRANVTANNQHDSPKSSTEKPSSASKLTADEDEGPSRLSVLDILRVLAGLILLSITLSYFITGNSITWGYRPAFTRPARIKAWLVRPLPTPLRYLHFNQQHLTLYTTNSGVPST